MTPADPIAQMTSYTTKRRNNMHDRTGHMCSWRAHELPGATASMLAVWHTTAGGCASSPCTLPHIYQASLALDRRVHVRLLGWHWRVAEHHPAAVTVPSWRCLTARSVLLGQRFCSVIIDAIACIGCCLWSTMYLFRKCGSTPRWSWHACAARVVAHLRLPAGSCRC